MANRLLEWRDPRSDANVSVLTTTYDNNNIITTTTAAVWTDTRTRGPNRRGHCTRPRRTDTRTRGPNGCGHRTDGQLVEEASTTHRGRSIYDAALLPRLEVSACAWLLNIGSNLGRPVNHGREAALAKLTSSANQVPYRAETSRAFRGGGGGARASVCGRK